MSSFGRDDRDLHDAKGGHLKAPAGDRTRWNARMEAHIELHVRRERIVEASPSATNMWELGYHVPRQLRTPLAET